MVQVLFNNPFALIISGNICSSIFPMTRSSRQGCPLSPILFCISLELIAQLIRLSAYTVQHRNQKRTSLNASLGLTLLLFCCITSTVSVR
uniref:Uncharacterized protein n=1 Tax=Neogobius melanostomus TaxID=47308 RepID=A0A8C6UJ88_9GOBI